MTDPSTSEWRSIMSDTTPDLTDRKWDSVEVDETGGAVTKYAHFGGVGERTCVRSKQGRWLREGHGLYEDAECPLDHPEGSPVPTVDEALAANEAAKKHRYTYPADAGDVPAGTKFNYDYTLREDGTLVDNHPVVPTVKFEHDINMPSHYTHLPVEAIDITEHFNFNMGNALKYIWRADYKGDPVKDLRKAAWYIDREIARRERE